MSWKRAVSAGAKQQAKDNGGSFSSPSRCAFPGCNKRVSSHGVCSKPQHIAWALAD